MPIEISKNSLSNRRLYLKNRRTLIDFAEEGQLACVTLGDALDEKSIEALPADRVSVGTHALRLHAVNDADAAGTADAADDARVRHSRGKHPRTMSFTYTPKAPLCLVGTPLLTFAFSAYDGERSSQYFAEVAENKYFVERPDPLLVSRSFITVTLLGGGRRASRTVQLTCYGFNRIYANFAGERVIESVEAIRFDYILDEEVPAWQRILKLDTVEAAMEVDFTFKGNGMEVLFEAAGGTVTHEGGALTYVWQNGSALTLPDLTDAKDTVCDIFLPIKNTVVLRLESSTPTLDLTVAFKTDAECDFSEDKQKTFRLTGVDSPRTVYLNLSDHPKARGRLTGLRLSPADPDGPAAIDGPAAGGAETLTIRKISFEQEARLLPTAGRFLSCVADTEKSIITFTVETDPAFAGQTLGVYDVFPADIHPAPDKLECVASGLITGGRLTLTAPLMRGKVTRVASQFFGAVYPAGSTPAGEGTYTPLAGRTVIENWQDICTPNPYTFDLPERLFDVTDPDFGAAGDGFTNDTEAIQAALDAACAAGGGVVVIPGGRCPACGDSGADMGRRYMVTNLRLRSFVELRVEAGAVLWQADDIACYKELPRFGHNVSMTGVNWPANHTSGNMPLLYARREERFRLTGGGTIRLCDTESYSEDGYFGYIGDNVCIGCCDRMHVCPIGITECDTFEVSNLAVIRSSAVYLSLGGNRHGYFANLLLDESKCTGADGMWPSGSDGMVFTRILLNDNDDGICLSSSYNDPRDMLWCFTYPGTERSTRNVELSHSRFKCNPQGSAVSFCIWGTNSPDLEKQEVRDIHIFDTVLEGRLAIGGWTDNPYYGVFPFDCSEQDDFSPVRNLRVHDCEFRSPVDIGGVRVTNFENDFAYPSPSQFERGDFRRRPAEQNPDWRLGLANWSYTTREAVDQIILYGDACAVVLPQRGKVSDLWQGLSLTEGTHTMRFKYKAGGTFRAFVKRPTNLRRPTGAPAATELVAEASFSSLPGGYFEGRDWQEGELTFTVPKDGLYHLGVEADFRETIALYVTDFRMDA